MKRSLRSWLWRVPIEQEVEEEIAFHVEMRVRELIERGMDPASARAVAVGRLGDVTRLRRTCVDLGKRRDREMLEGIGREATSSARFRAVLVGAFATLALTLAVVGVFGVLAYSVQQRVREFGVRIALGATTRNVLLMVFGGTIRMIGAGLVIGLAAAAVLGQSMSTFLFGVRPVDPLTFVGAAVLLAVTAALATAVPAFRAANVDPIVALRQD